MASISYCEFNKNKVLLRTGSFNVRRIDYLCALTFLHGPLDFFNSISLFLSYLFRLNSDISFKNNKVFLSANYSHSYDGIKKGASEIYGVANTIIFATKQRGQKFLLTPFLETK